MDKAFALIVEDHQMLATFFAEALQEADYETEIAKDGQAALDRLQEIVPDLVLLDLHLPFVTGEEILQYIRSDSRLEKIRVIVASVDGTRSVFLEKEADFVFSKPVGYKQLRLLASRLNNKV